MEDSEGLRLSRWGVQGVAAGVASRALVITQEEDAATGFRLGEDKDRQECESVKKLYAAF